MSVWSDLQTAVAQRISRTKTLGHRGERAAERFLRRKGWKIVARGYQNHVGEVDLIAVQYGKARSVTAHKTVVFVEVKTRESDSAGHPAEAVDDRKQRQIVETALVFLKQHDLLESRFRFDIISILWPADEKRPQIEHLLDAFQPTEQGQLFS